MTDEEKAEDYEIDCIADVYRDDVCIIPYAYSAPKIVQAYIDGLIEGRKEKWHDLRKNPDDLPKDNEYVVIYTDLKNTYVARIPIGKDYYIARTGEFIQGLAVIAWCELPKFEE